LVREKISNPNNYCNDFDSTLMMSGQQDLQQAWLKLAHYTPYTENLSKHKYLETDF
jgi:hypothetical protein